MTEYGYHQTDHLKVALTQLGYVSLGDLQKHFRALSLEQRYAILDAETDANKRMLYINAIHAAGDPEYGLGKLPDDEK